MGSTAESEVASVYEEIPNIVNATENYEMQYNNSYVYPEGSKSEIVERVPSKKTGSSKNTLFLVIFIAGAITVVVLIVAIAFCVVKFVEMSGLQSEVDSLTSRLNQSIAESEEFQSRLSQSIAECKELQPCQNKTAQYDEYQQTPNTTSTAESIYCSYFKQTEAQGL